MDFFARPIIVRSMGVCVKSGVLLPSFWVAPSFFHQSPVHTVDTPKLDYRISLFFSSFFFTGLAWVNSGTWTDLRMSNEMRLPLIATHTSWTCDQISQLISYTRLIYMYWEFGIWIMNEKAHLWTAKYGSFNLILYLKNPVQVLKFEAELLEKKILSNSNTGFNKFVNGSTGITSQGTLHVMKDSGSFCIKL